MRNFKVTISHSPNVKVHWFQIHTKREQSLIIYEKATSKDGTISTKFDVKVNVFGDKVHVNMYAEGDSYHVVTYNITLNGKKLFAEDIEATLEDRYVLDQQKNVSI